MAIFYCQTQNMSRRQGHSSVAAAAYRAGEKLTDERRGDTHDYRGKIGVVDTFLVNSGGLSRAELWNAAEAFEVRSDARVAREWQLALPHELDSKSHRAILEDFSKFLVGRYGVAVDVAIHAPGREGDHRNVHAHLMMSTRAMGSDGQFSTEKTELNRSDKRLRQQNLPTGKQQVEAIRKQWASTINWHLERAGSAERVDHRSLKNQGITDRIPTPHMGKAATAKIRRGQKTHAYEKFDSARAFNSAMAEVEGRKKRLLKFACPYGVFAPHLPLRRQPFSTPEPVQNWRPAASRGKNILKFFSGRESGVFRWPKGRAEGRAAFIHTRRGIESYSTNSWAISAQLELAQQKVESGEWRSIRLAGSDEFRRMVWLQSQDMGIAVEGYKPTRSEQKTLSSQATYQVLGLTPKRSGTTTPTLGTKKTSRGMGL